MVQIYNTVRPWYKFTIQSGHGTRPAGRSRAAAANTRRSATRGCRISGSDTSITWVPRAGGASPWPSCRCRPPRRRGRRRATPAAAAAASAPSPARRRRAPSARGGGRRTPATCSRGCRCSWLLAAATPPQL
uniref:Uncharacterized protein n=1 Tax=Setaria viridis TaxID=4556 RepID=A0A4U6W885_SETVI|nr:hypothetical protein SEVIR_1G078126v2 [Setaria viridis]